MKKFVNIKNARRGEYRKVIKEIALKGECPFCPENFKYHKKPIFKRKEDWFLTNDSWPYKNTSCHLIILGKKHKEKFQELTKKDLESVAYLTRWAIKKYKIKGGGLAIRFGNTDFTGASVTHIHFHLISPKIDKKTKYAKTVNFPIG
ncbi:MAG: HIT domain-containing protein [Candidatus Pacebacteria bacterium]|nr:HIT domain-containing protein [Candidatus Paceibacterota bacterium]